MFASLAVVHHVLPLFNASPRIQTSSSPYVRWDALHLLAITNAGYRCENHWAFLPGVSFLTNLLRSLPTEVGSYFLFLPPISHLYAVQHHWIRATLCFILASFFRSNGVLLAGYLVWGLVVQPFLDGKQLSFFKIAYSITLSACVTAPLIYHNYSAYCLFCNIHNKPQWCYRIPPSIHTHVQANYWDVGFLRYWTPSQIRNFVIAAPPLVLLITFSVQHIKISFLGFRIRLNSVKETNKEENPFAMPSITPYLIHWSVLWGPISLGIPPAYLIPKHITTSLQHTVRS
ncbi:GPI mannosyltransferase 2 [Termitomyces sp. J132]|nr:GPI mannosyltransferase 2 [Termitomyces sp. J132]